MRTQIERPGMHVHAFSHCFLLGRVAGHGWSDLVVGTCGVEGRSEIGEFVWSRAETGRVSLTYFTYHLIQFVLPGFCHSHSRCLDVLDRIGIHFEE